MEFKTTVAQIECKLGMLYAIQLNDGRFILIDGGKYFEEDSERLYRYLTEKSQTDRPVIACWLFTHGHSDHIQLASHFMEQYKEKIIIENFAYNIPVEGMDFCGYDKRNQSESEANEKAWYQAIEYYPQAARHVLKTKDSFAFANAQVDILSTAFDRYPDPPTDRNETSAILKITFDNKRSFMLLGDSKGERLIKLLDPTSPTYCTNEFLKSDIMQVAHHGLYVCKPYDYQTVTDLYRTIAPEICFWPTPAARFYNDPWCQSTEYPYNRFLLDSVKEKNFHNSQTVEIDIDDWKIHILKIQ